MKEHKIKVRLKKSLQFFVAKNKSKKSGGKNANRISIEPAPPTLCGHVMYEMNVKIDIKISTSPTLFLFEICTLLRVKVKISKYTKINIPQASAGYTSAFLVL